MATSFYDELHALLMHGLEQTELFQQVTTAGRTTVDVAEVVPSLVKLIGNHGNALHRIAGEIDELRAAINER